MAKTFPGMNDTQMKAFWGWWEQKDQTYTKADIDCLLERVKKFNAGAIDAYLSNHVDHVYEEWLMERSQVVE